MHKVIGFHGLPGAGKSTIINKLELREVNFATPLKEQVFSLYNAVYKIPRKCFFGTQADKTLDFGEFDERLKGKGVTGRKALKAVGTEGYRSHNDSIWIDAADTTIKFELHLGHQVGVGDVRFPNEFDLVRKHGGVVIGLQRFDREYEMDGHASDILHFDDCDMVINNIDTPLVETLEQVQVILEALSP